MINLIIKRLFKNASVLFGGSSIAGLMGLVSISLAARTLGAETLGTLAMIQSYTMIMDRLVNFQCWQAIIKFGADFLKQNRKDDFKSLVKFCLLLDAATAVAGTALAAGVVYLFGQWKHWHEQTIYAAIAYSLWILFNLRGTATGLLRLFDKFRPIAAANITAAALKLILSTCAYLLSGNLMVFTAVWVVSGIAESVFLLIAGLRQLDKNTEDGFLKAKLSIIVKDKKLWKFVLSTNLNLSVSLAAKEIDMLIVGAVLGTAATGIYKIAKQFASIPIQLIEPIYHSIYPEMARLAAEKNFSYLKQLAAKTSVMVGGASLLIWFAFMLFGRWILNIAAGAEYVQAYNVMLIYMFAFVVCGFSFCLPVGLLAMGRAAGNLLIQVICLAIFLPALYLLLNIAGLIGASIAQVIFFCVYALLSLLLLTGSISKESDRCTL